MNKNKYSHPLEDDNVCRLFDCICELNGNCQKCDTYIGYCKSEE